ncbi:MAG: glutathione S-transferase [Phormidesmis sp. RL_2_1]|nr:glutathione S-transferase [Phormidesmis sp. RL_2_1]
MEGAFESDLDGEIPEEILRTEIITAARSPLTGEPLTPAEYAQLLDELERKPATEASVSENIRYIVLLLQIRRAIQPIVPFF